MPSLDLRPTFFLISLKFRSGIVNYIGNESLSQQLLGRPAPLKKNGAPLPLYLLHLKKKKVLHTEENLISQWVQVKAPTPKKSFK